MLGFPVHHQVPELIHTHVHRVSDANQPSHPLLSLLEILAITVTVLTLQIVFVNVLALQLCSFISVLTVLHHVVQGFTCTFTRFHLLQDYGKTNTIL